MQPLPFNKKTVNFLPLEKLWDDQKWLEMEKVESLTFTQVKALLPEAELVIADIGSKLNWIENDLVYKTWRTELKDHLSDSPGDFNSDYFYYASLWVGEGRKVVLLEKYH